MEHRMSREAVQLGTSLTIVPWADPVVDSVGHDPRSIYVERFWLPVLGPTTVWLIRRLASDLDRHPDGIVVDLPTLGAELGLNDTTSRNGPFARSFTRAVQFGVAQPFGPALAVRRRLPYVPERHVNKFPAALRTDHAEHLRREDHDTATRRRQRAYSLALTLMRLGEPDQQVEWQLTQWRFPTELAADATRWAAARITTPDDEHQRSDDQHRTGDAASAA